MAGRCSKCGCQYVGPLGMEPLTGWKGFLLNHCARCDNIFLSLSFLIFLAIYIPLLLFLDIPKLLYKKVGKIGLIIYLVALITALAIPIGNEVYEIKKLADAKREEFKASEGVTSEAEQETYKVEAKEANSTKDVRKKSKK